MELKEFISETLFQIQEGVQSAIKKNQDAGTTGAINPVWAHDGKQGNVSNTEKREVSFDIAVTINEKAENNVGAGIKVMGIGIGGDIADTSESSHVSRIQFSVPVIPPTTNVHVEPLSLNFEGMN